MKKMFIALLFVVSTVFSVSAKTVAIELSCGQTIMTDDSSFEVTGGKDGYKEVMEEIFC